MKMEKICPFLDNEQNVPFFFLGDAALISMA